VKVFVLDPIGANGVDILAKSGVDVVLWGDPAVGNWREEADGIVLRGTTSVTADDIARAKNLKAISKEGAGVDRIDLEAAANRGIVVMNTPGSNAEAVAEFTVGLTLALARRIAVADRRLRLGDAANREEFKGRGLAGKTVGIVGMGHIGRKVARKWNLAFDMPVIGYDPNLPDGAWAELGYEQASNLDDLLRRADLVSIHVPLIPPTRNLIGARELGMMKPTSMLVCTSRGGVVDEAALYDALMTERIYGAALDVFVKEPPPVDHPLFGIPTFVATPHIGGASFESREAGARMAVEQLLEVLGGGAPRNVVTAMGPSGSGGSRQGKGQP
jgi:D-3-phosphoglycerate dehydrogenase